MKFSYTKIASTIFAALLLPACGGGSSSSPDCQGDNCGDTPNPPVPDVIQYDLKVNVQDYADKVDDAVVCIDMNDDNVCSNVATNANVSTNANEVVDIGVVKTKNGFVTFKVTSEDMITGKNILAYSSNKSVSLRAPISKEDLKDNQVNEFFVTPLTDVLSKYIELSGKNAKNAKKELADTMGISVDAFNKSVTTKGSALNVLVETLDVLDVAKAKDAQEILQKTTQSFTKIEEAIKNDVKPEQIVSDVVNNSEKENPFEDVRTEPE